MYYINMIENKILSKLIKTVYVFFYLISQRYAISQDLNKNLLVELENGLNDRNIISIEKYFDRKELSKLNKKFIKTINQFPNAKWKLKDLSSAKENHQKIRINLIGSKFIENKKYHLNSNFNFIFTLENGIIKNSRINNQLTTIRNDNNIIKLDISIPEKVLTGSNYNIDIIVNNPLDNIAIAGGLKQHLEGDIFNQTISLEPLATGGIFRVTRAPIKPGTQVWTGLIAHPKGIVTFTKSVEIVKKY